MKPYALALQIIREFEGCRLTAYLDSVGVPTIGYGTTHAVHMGMTITQGQAEAFLAADVQDCAETVAHFVTVPIAENELCALISLTYNIGIGAFEKSTLLRELNAGIPRIDVAAQFLRWCRGGGQVLPGLLRRRKAERALFLYPQAIPVV